MGKKIDFIITWVDGSDPKWKQEKNFFRKNKNSNCNNTIRYRNWDTLKFWFRGVEKFAPWVNKIHFITWGHLPKWLNVDHPKINIVNHKDFIPNKYLPTFNSVPIELNFHRIKGLADKFVYFNDDMFIIDKVKKSDFFKNGNPCDSLIFTVIPPSKDQFSKTLFNNMSIINKYFNKTKVIKNNIYKIFNIKYSKHLLRSFLALPWTELPGIYNPHLQVSYKKSTFNKIWGIESQVLSNACKEKFRNYDDINHFLLRYWRLMSGDFFPSKIKGKYFYVSKDISLIKKAIIKQKYKTICINDEKIDNSKFSDIKNDIHFSFNKILPIKSSFEIKS